MNDRHHMTDGTCVPASPSSGDASAAPASHRIAALDGLRGGAALTVLIYHYLCLAHPTWTASMVAVPNGWVDLPVYLLWNGPFAVALFFVLSGLVMASAAERSRASLAANTGARYLRLAIPAAASCLLAWAWLSLLPAAADGMADTMQGASRWLGYTYQDDIKTPAHAMAEGLAGIFLRGYSRFNNVLWTLKIELFGSLAVFALYSLTAGRLRLILLALGSVILPALSEPSYLAFCLGAALYEANRRGLLARLDAILGLRAAVLIGAVLLAFPGEGFHLREGFAFVPAEWRLGEHRGYLHVIGAALLVVAVLRFGWLSALFCTRPALWLGRMSFSLYLVHVPLLYTFVAWLHVETALPSAVLAAGYIAAALGLAMVFERVVDAPLLTSLPRLRTNFDRRTGYSRTMP